MSMYDGKPVKYPAAEIITQKSEVATSLESLAVEINSEYAYGLSMAQKATECMIKVGKLLLTAREKFPGDHQFGHWLQKNVEFSASHASRKIVQDHSNGPVTPVSSAPSPLVQDPVVIANKIKEKRKPAETPKLEENVNEIEDILSPRIMKPFKERLDEEDPFIIFGITPLFDGTINPEVISILYAEYCKHDLTPKGQKILDTACAMIKQQLYSTDDGR